MSFCDARHAWVRQDFYTRYVITIEEGSSVLQSLVILRLICHSCDTTHAILPYDVIPYQTYAFSFVLEVLIEVFVLETPVNNLKKNWLYLNFLLLHLLLMTLLMHLLKEAFFRQLASSPHTLPNGQSIKFAPKTLKKYYLSYLHDGFDGLMPKKRNDKSRPRVLSESAIARIVELKNQFPHTTRTLIYQKLIEEGAIKASGVSLSSFLRYIRSQAFDTYLSSTWWTGVLLR